MGAIRRGRDAVEFFNHIHNTDKMNSNSHQISMSIDKHSVVE